MNDVPLKALGLEKKWARLARLQEEVAGLQKQALQAGTEVESLQNQLAPAREKDLDAEARAMRSGKEAPEATHEPEIQRRLERARRDHAVLSRAAEAATADLGVFRAKHRAQLFEDVARARHEIAQEVARSAREALAAFGNYENLHYALKDLQPPATAAEPSAPARNTNVFMGFNTTRRAGPDRGVIEGTLQHLISLAETGEVGGADAA